MSTPTIQQLADELTDRVKSTSTFTNSGFQVYNLQDMDSFRQTGAALPMAGIAYEGSEIKSQELTTSRPSSGSARTNTQVVRFSVIIGIDYRGAGGPDTKKSAMSLMQEVRDVLHGFRGVNTRPWTFVYEAPLDGDSDGVVYYGQLWMTDVFLTGNHTAQ